MTELNSKGMHLGQIAEKLDMMAESIAKLSEMQTLLSVQIEDLEKSKTEHLSKELLNVTEASRLLRISKGYLYKLVQTKAIPSHKPNGKVLYFVRSELLDWIKNDYKISDSNGILYR